MNFKEFDDLYQFYPNLSYIQNLSLILFSTICSLLIYKLLKSSEYIRVCEIGRPETMRRRLEECPAVYPNGWQPILESKDLKKGQVLSLFRLGYDLAVYRGQSGKVYVLDAYCPHLGANLGVGGTVVDDCVRCPFHAWIFNESGVCVSAPGVEKSKTPKAQIKVWDSIEVNGFIFVWYHMNGEKPNWVLENNPMYCKRNHRGRLDITMNCHIQEISENGSDVVHLYIVHNPFMKTSDGFTINNLLSKIFAMTADIKFEESAVPNRHIGTSLSKDITIWNNKKYISNPMIAKNEPELKKYRRWVKQFF